MKNSGLKNEAQVAKIFVSGSTALPAKNSNGVRLFEQSDLSDGIIAGKLIRPKYNTNELKKSIDTEIFELLPNVVPDLPDTVLRSIYDESLERIDVLNLDIEGLNNRINTLNSTISELEILNESLKIEADNQTLAANIADEQRAIANAQIAETTIDLQNAIQNSINEAVQRVSLTARIEALSQENINLREQLYGLAAQTAEGAKSGGNNTFTVKVDGGKVDPNGNDLYVSTNHNAGNSRVMGVKLEINNVTANNKITNVQFTIDGDVKWFKLPTGPNEIEAESFATYNVEYDNDVIGGEGTGPGKRGGIEPRRRRIGWKGSAKSYEETNLVIKVTFDNGDTDEITLSTRLQKNRRS